AIVQYLADQKPDSGLAPRFGTFERYKLMETLNWITSELHKSFGPLFAPDTSADVKKGALESIHKKLDWLSASFGDKKFVQGDTFTVADAYLFTILSWTGHVGIDLKKWPVLAAYSARVSQRPKVHEALKAEGLIR
ncbi:MAG: glutathione binding-like protein, partial [Steroidobacteraceae bacterium]